MRTVRGGCCVCAEGDPHAEGCGTRPRARSSRPTKVTSGFMVPRERATRRSNHVARGPDHSRGAGRPGAVEHLDPAWVMPVLASFASLSLAAFPVIRAGRLPHQSFRGLLGVHRVAARVVAEPPWAARRVGVLRTMSLPPPSAPIATGWSESCRAGFAPAGEWHLVTAHPNRRLSDAARLLRRTCHLYQRTKNPALIRVNSGARSMDAAIP